MTRAATYQKADWENQVASAGMYFIDPAGADPQAEAKQSGRLGFLQPDEPDLPVHVNLAGSKIGDLRATYQQLQPLGVPVWLNLSGSSFDNEWYDGTPHPSKTDASKWGHRAATGGYMAWADRIGFDYHLWSTNRAGKFEITKRLMDRAHDWSGGKPIFVYFETCTQGTGLPFNADNFEAQVWNAVNYAEQKGYKLAGLIGFADAVFPHWTAYDVTPADVAGRMPSVFSKVLSMANGNNPTPAPVPVTPTPGTPQVVLILGNYKSVAQHKALADAITNKWKPVLGNTPFFVTKWDNDVAKEINTTYPSGPIRIVGFSFGGSKAVDVCKELGTRPVEKLILIDPVPHPPNVPKGPGIFPGFDIPENVASVYCGYRWPDEQKAIFSAPIHSARGLVVNEHFAPTPGKSEDEQHGQLIWNGVAVKQVVGK